MTAYSLLDLVPIVQGGSAAQALANAADLARHAESLGFTRYWVAEHHGMEGIASAATAVVIAHVGAATATIRVGAGGIMLPNHSPLQVAEAFGTLDALFPGRVDLGLGRAPGSDQRVAAAIRRGLGGDGNEFPQDVLELQSYFADDGRTGVRATPGAGADVRLWILGSSLFGAQLAAALGLPYAFASHFAPRYMHEAIRVYRNHFKPSAVLDKPYVMLGVPLVAADTDEQADYLATSVYQRILALMRGQSLVQRKPVKSMDGLWLPHEKEAVGSFLGLAMIGSPAKIRAKLEVLIEQTGADELIFTCDLYEHADRLHSYELLAQVMKG